ncbi:glycosyltransferase [Actinotalea subterranea]|uniref:glycosyltransferase n=1 Tax=Actinotalea subterranea TaxID=2607497 RepID=UPI0011EEFF92|nr:glycosyltransferase [Actinotalea subterranea]
MSGPRLLLVAPPFSGHLNPLIGLATGLRARGMEPRFATGAAKVDLLRGLGFAVEPLLADDPGALERISDTPGPVRSNPVLLLRQLSANLALLPTVRRELDVLVDRDRPDAVLADFTAPVAGLVALDRGIPWLTTMPTPFALETRTGTPSYCGGWGPARHAGHRVRDAAGRAATRATKRTMQRVLASRFAAAGTGVYRADGSEAAYSPQSILGLGMRELELPRDWPDQLELVGPVTATPEPWPEPPVLPPGPLVLVTMGTHLPWVKRDLVERVRVLADSFRGHRFVVSLGDASRAAPHPVAQDGDVHVYSHLPYDDVLPRCAAVVHHGGAGITYSAVRAGVPALVCPQDYDQFDFAARVVAAGAGASVRRLDSPAAVRAMRALLDADRGPLERLSRAAATYDPVGATERAVLRLIARR